MPYGVIKTFPADVVFEYLLQKQKNLFFIFPILSKEALMQSPIEFWNLTIRRQSSRQGFVLLLVCSRRSDSRAGKKLAWKKKNSGKRGERERVPSLSPQSPLVCPAYDLTRSPPSQLRALLSDCLEEDILHAIYRQEKSRPGINNTTSHNFNLTYVSALKEIIFYRATYTVSTKPKQTMSWRHSPCEK